LEKFLLQFSYRHQDLNQQFQKAGKSAQDLSHMLQKPPAKENEENKEVK
jgi:hypothetical protein